MPGKSNRKILVIEDEPEIVELLREALKEEGLEIHSAGEGKRAVPLAVELRPMLIILDLGLPDISGIDVCHKLKKCKATEDVPVIFLTGRKSESDIVLGLEIGGEDYITKPFHSKEVVARIRAVIRRNSRRASAGEGGEQIEIGPIQINSSRFEMLVHKKPVKLTLSEFKILWTLVAAPGRVFTRDQLLDKISSEQLNSTDRVIDVHMAAIRKKLGRAGKQVVAIRGIGYKFND